MFSKFPFLLLRDFRTALFDTNTKTTLCPSRKRTGTTRRFGRQQRFDARFCVNPHNISRQCCVYPEPPGCRSIAGRFSDPKEVRVDCAGRPRWKKYKISGRTNIINRSHRYVGGVCRPAFERSPGLRSRFLGESPVFR